eukprot:COSAG06_NODE_29020_length_563_cov_12.325431_2_plen_57_part_01
METRNKCGKKLDSDPPASPHDVFVICVCPLVVLALVLWCSGALVLFCSVLSSDLFSH